MRFRAAGRASGPAGATTMTIRGLRMWGFAALATAVVGATGCQTWIGGMTLPSGHYLEGHPPQYFPEEPDFPLTKELSYQEEAAGLLNPRDRDRAKNPNPVPGVPGAGVAK